MGRSNLQRFIRSRLVRLSLAAAVIALSVWAFLPYVGYRISTSAFVNAELVRVTAPIAGRLTRDLPRKGDFIEQPAVVTLIDTRLPKSVPIWRRNNWRRSRLLIASFKSAPTIIATA